MPPETLDSLDQDSLKLLVLELLAQNKALTEQISVLLARIAELEARNGQPPKTPTNSSVPPSKGQKANRPEAPAQKKSRKGRPGVARALCPDPDVTREIYAESCSCGAMLSPADQSDVFAYDLIDLPPIKPVTTRINLHKGNCPCCGKRVAAQPPADMAPGTPFGPGVVSLVTYLHACQMVSYNRMTEMLDGLFGLKLSEGAIANMLARAAKPFAARADEIAETVRQSPVIASDETSARVCGKTHWQWTFAAATAVYHTIAPTRGKVVPAAFLGQANRRCGSPIASPHSAGMRTHISIASPISSVMLSMPLMQATPCSRPPSSAFCKRPAPSAGGAKPSPTPRSKLTHAIWTASSIACSPSRQRRRTAAIFRPACSSTRATSCSCS